MTFVSKLALATVLTLGSTALAGTPAFAQKQEQQQGGAPDLKLSKEFRAAAAPADASVKASNWTAAAPQVAAAEAAAKTDDERYFAAWMRLKVALGTNNDAATIAALQALSTNPSTPAANRGVIEGQLALMRAKAASRDKNHAEVIKNLARARELGQEDGEVPIMLANAYAATGNNAQAVAETDKAIKAAKAAGRKAPMDYYKFAIPRVNQLGDRAAMADWLTRFIQDYPTVQNWRWAIQVFNQGVTGTSERVERLALYRLMRSTNALADRSDYAAYAFYAQQAGLPWEAVQVVEEGRKSGKLPTGDTDVQRTFAAAQAGVKSEGSLETLAKQAGSAATGKPASQTADAFLASGNYARAVSLYDTALQKGGANVDEVNLNRAIALARQGSKEEARAGFQQVKGAYANLALLWQASLDFPPLT